MAIVPVSLQPSGQITTINKDGIKVVTNFKIAEVSFCVNPPVYEMEEVCPNCGGNKFSYLVQGKTCVRCNEKIVFVVELNLKNDDIINSRFDILDL